MIKSVLITGGAHRLGAMLCNAFAQSGWGVWCHFNNSEDEANSLCQTLRNKGFTAQVIQADLSDDTQRQRMMAHIESHSGSLHCLINNASSFQPDTATSINAVSVRQQLETNLIAPITLSAMMAKSIPDDDRSGSRGIIHVLDQKIFNLNPDYYSYTVSKLALERTVELQAQALSPKLRVCGVAPGLMFLSGPQAQENFEVASRINLMRRATDPAQVAASCLFLAENPCITGVTLLVDNGQHLIPLPRDVMFVVDDFLKAHHVR